MEFCLNMTERLDITFDSLDSSLDSTVVVLAEEKLALSVRASQLNRRSGGQIKRAAAVEQFQGILRQHLNVIAPNGLKLDRVLVVGITKANQLAPQDWVSLGGRIFAQLASKTTSATVILDVKSKRLESKIAAALAQGLILRSYRFDRYKSSNDNGSKKSKPLPRLQNVKIICHSPRAATRAFIYNKAVAEGVLLARDLVNEPANTLGPVEFAERAGQLETLAVDCEILDVDALTNIGMGALLAVGHGSDRPSRVVVMRWMGAKSPRTRPIAFIGKGVVFDTGGISLKPAKGMEDMKGDMGGAAAVVGTMHALAARKAAVNAVGVIGLVENMPSAKAQRPGDIVTSLSQKTVEVLNTDAEGRLVLADLLWYTQDRFNPKLMIDLATLTGAIMIALGQEYAGLYANDDRLANQLREAGEATDELVWRMPLAAAYDKQIDSKNADMRNIGGRWGGSITAAQFLQRFVRKLPWAHLDIAGTAFDSRKTDVNDSWGSGFGVRLLDRLVADHYEQ